MKSILLSRGLVVPIVFVLLVATAGLTPWWGTPIVVAAIRLLFRTSQRVLGLLTFVAWGLMCVVRDSISLYGPSRVFAKLCNLEAFGLEIDSNPSRFAVYAMVGLVGMMLALLSAGVVKSIQNLWTYIRTPALAR